MTPRPETDNVFIIVNLFLLTVVALMLLIQLIAWVITVINNKRKKRKNHLTNKSYETLLAAEGYHDIAIKKVKTTIKFANYDNKTNCLKLSKRNFQETTVWNIYQNLVSITLIKWKKSQRNNRKRKTNITLIVSTLIFSLSAVTTIILSLIYYLNLKQGTIDQINTTALSILSFIVLLALVLSWLIWTMTYEKIRKEIIELAKTFDDAKLLKIIKIISSYKTLFPCSELLF